MPARGSALRPPGHLVWFGVLLALAGLVSYFTLAVRVPALRDRPLLNLAAVLAGVVLTGWALVRRVSLGSVVGFATALLCAVMLFGYVFVVSEQLPDAGSAVAVGSVAPGLALPDQEGRPVRLADFAGRPLVVVFYRGFW